MLFILFPRCLVNIVLSYRNGVFSKEWLKSYALTLNGSVLKLVRNCALA